MIKLAIADDDPRLSRQLRAELLEYPEFQSISCYQSGLTLAQELDGLAVTQRPDIIIMDISMAGHDEGIAATFQIKRKFPEIQVIMFTVSDDDDHIFDAFKAGAMGYLLKNEQPSFILKTIQEVLQGGAVMSPGIALKTIRFLVSAAPVKKPETPEDYNLTEREVEILRNIAKGSTYQAMANQLFISTETVKKHVANIYKKLHVRNKIEALIKAKDLLQ
jgi:DNA-binding NarL/FixJ family response regulator